MAPDRYFKHIHHLIPYLYYPWHMNIRRRNECARDWKQHPLKIKGRNEITCLTMCLCLSTQYLMALLTSISCFFVNPFGPTPPLKFIPAVGRNVAVKSVLLLYIPRRSMSNMFSPCGGVGGGGGASWVRTCSALPAWRREAFEEFEEMIVTSALICQYVFRRLRISAEMLSKRWKSLFKRA